MSTDNKEFFDLLNSISTEQTFSLPLSPRESAVEEVQCKPLTTIQLKELIKTIVDSPLTQAAFNTTATKIFKQSLVATPSVPLNVIDRLLFIIESRIQSISPKVVIKTDNTSNEVDLEEVKTKLKQQLLQHSELLASSSATEGKLCVKYGVALLDAETQLNEELYKNLTIDVENTEELRKILGEAFINEIAKVVQTVTIEDKTMDLSSVTFKTRLKVIESLPASVIQKVIEYIEKYKKLLEDCLSVDGQTIPIDGSLFSLR